MIVLKGIEEEYPTLNKEYPMGKEEEYPTLNKEYPIEKESSTFSAPSLRASLP
jgi:hypothetical protein